MSVREYEIRNSSEVSELRRQLIETLEKGSPLKIEAPAVADDLSTRRGKEQVRSFVFTVVSIERVPEGLQALAQEDRTSAWATLTVTDTVATITVVD